MRSGPPLVLHPRACDRCGRCLDACPKDALRVGRTYLKVDWTVCDGCGACVKACGRGALTLKGGVRRATGGGARAQSAPRPPSATPRSRSSAKKASGSQTTTAGGLGALLGRIGGGAGTPKTGARGGFQWTLLEAAAMLSVTFSAFVVKETISASEAMAAVPPDLATPARIGVLALYYAVQVAVLVWLVRRRGGDTIAALGLRRHGGGVLRGFASAGLVVGGLVATRLLASAYAYLTRVWGLMPAEGANLPELFGADAAGFILAVVMVVLVGPVVEEAVFRAALLEGLAARFGAWPAIAAQAALFAALHRSLWLLFPTFVLGVALGYLAHERESLWPPIALHALYNAMTVAAAFLVVPTA